MLKRLLALGLVISLLLAFNIALFADEIADRNFFFGVIKTLNEAETADYEIIYEMYSDAEFTVEMFRHYFPDYDDAYFCDVVDNPDGLFPWLIGIRRASQASDGSVFSYKVKGATNVYGPIIISFEATFLAEDYPIQFQGVSEGVAHAEERYVAAVKAQQESGASVPVGLLPITKNDAAADELKVAFAKTASGIAVDGDIAEQPSTLVEVVSSAETTTLSEVVTTALTEAETAPQSGPPTTLPPDQQVAVSQAETTETVAPSNTTTALSAQPLNLIYFILNLLLALAILIALVVASIKQSNGVYFVLGGATFLAFGIMAAPAGPAVDIVALFLTLALKILISLLLFVCYTSLIIAVYKLTKWQPSVDKNATILSVTAASSLQLMPFLAMAYCALFFLSSTAVMPFAAAGITLAATSAGFKMTERGCNNKYAVIVLSILVLLLNIGWSLLIGIAHHL